MLKSGNSPKFYRWGGGGVAYSWSLGWLTGKDGDLVCVRPNLRTALEGETNLSPVCSNRPVALFASVLKIILAKIDRNMRF